MVWVVHVLYSTRGPTLAVILDCLMRNNDKFGPWEFSTDGIKEVGRPSILFLFFLLVGCSRALQLHNCSPDSWTDEATASDKEANPVPGTAATAHTPSQFPTRNMRKLTPLFRISLELTWDSVSQKKNKIKKKNSLTCHSHHDDSNNQSRDSDQVDLHWKQLLNPIVAVLQSEEATLKLSS